MKTSLPTTSETITFIGGGNMASALIKGLISGGFSPDQILVIEPSDQARTRISQDFSIHCIEDPHSDNVWQKSTLFVWAIKPQQMKEVCESLAPLCSSALHLSVAAGISSSSLCEWLTTERVVRAMPNTPALIGLGQTGLFARPSVSQVEREQVERLIKGTGQCIWLADETLLDAVTAVSGSGPAYVFYFLEALSQAGIELGLSPDDSKQLAIGTFIGASQLALNSQETLSTLRERVTSKGGTTEAALAHMQECNIAEGFKESVKRAQEKALELGSNYGK